MATLTLAREARKLIAEARTLTPAADHPALRAIRADPAAILALSRMRPDPWQTELLRGSSDRVLILASRQVGKSLTAGALALREALLKPGSLVLLLSPTLRQSSELFREKVRVLYNALGRPVPAVQESALTMRFSNGSRVVSLPGSEATVRGFANVRLLIVDEAARVPDELYRAVRPMLAVSGGLLVCLSSAYAKQGFFFQAWANGGPEWERVKVPAAQCRRISPAFLEEERRELGARWYAREYECVFTEADDQLFDYESVQAALTAGGPAPLF